MNLVQSMRRSSKVPATPCRNIGDESSQSEPSRVNKWIPEQVTLAASERAINLKTASRHARMRVPSVQAGMTAQGGGSSNRVLNRA